MDVKRTMVECGYYVVLANSIRRVNVSRLLLHNVKTPRMRQIGWPTFYLIQPSSTSWFLYSCHCRRLPDINNFQIVDEYLKIRIAGTRLKRCAFNIMVCLNLYRNTRNGVSKSKSYVSTPSTKYPARDAFPKSIYNHESIMDSQWTGSYKNYYQLLPLC